MSSRLRFALLAVGGAALVVASLFFFRPPAEAPSPPPGPRIGKAGETTDVVPQAWRGENDEDGRELARANPIFWRDVVWTAPRGRARIAVLDGSVLNLGPETRLRIVPRHERSAHSAVELNFGKIRAVVKAAERRQERKLEIRTPTAVIGVVGTEFYVDTTEEKTRVICLEGQVTVQSREADVPGEETLSAGEKTEVVEAAPPRPKEKATADEIEQARAVTRSTPLDVEVVDRQGVRVNLRDRGGRVLVLHFWASWAMPAVQEMPRLDRLAAEFQGQPVDFIGVAMDTGGWAALEPVLRRMGVRYEVLLDSDNRAVQTLGVRAFPTTILVDQNGRIVARQEGPFNAAALRRALQRLL